MVQGRQMFASNPEWTDFNKRAYTVREKRSVGEERVLIIFIY